MPDPNKNWLTLLSPFNPIASKNVRLTVMAENILIKFPPPK